MNSRTISVSFVRALLFNAQARGLNITELLSASDIAPTILEQDRARVTINQYGMLHSLVNEALNDESCGYYKNPVRQGTFSAMTRYVLAASNLRQAIERNVEFQNLFDTGLSFHFFVNGKKAHYRLIPETGLIFPPFIYEKSLMISHRFFCWLTGTRFSINLANFNYPAPEHHAEYHYMFHCPINFGEAFSEIILDADLLDLPIVRSEAELEDYLQQQPYGSLQVPGRDKSYTEQIRRHIKKHLPNLPDYNHLAQKLKLNPQTLRRRLKEEGADYRQIKNEFIRDMAIDYLKRDGLEIKEIAYLLGFSEPSAFVRSFKKWTGTPPNTYRRENLFLARTPLTNHR